MLTAFAAVSLLHFGERLHEEPLTQFSVDLGPDALLGPRTTVALSRDGRRFVFPTKNGLATRRLEEAAATLLPGTSGAEDPFFSPDGEWIAFFADQKLKKVAVRGGAVVTLCDSPGDRGGSWGDDGNIVFQTSGSINSPLLRVSAQGGVPQPVSRFGSGDVTHRWPQVLPGASAVLFTNATQPANYDTANLDVMPLPSGRRKTVVRGGYYGRYVPETRGGYLVYIREGTLFGVQFDAKSLETRGTPAPLIENVASDTRSGSAQLDISKAGVLVYQSGKTGQGQDMGWLDGTGRSTPVLTKPGLVEPRFSPDGKRMAYHRPGNKARDVWIYDIEQDTHTQLTFTAAGTTHIAWAPDSEHLVYGAGSPPWNLWWIRADGSGRPQSLLTGESPLWPQSFTPDGRLAFIQGTGDIFTLPVDWSDPERPKAGPPQPFLTTPALEPEASFSSDGRWIAYQSNESGQPDLFVRPFPGPGTKYRISTDGGQFPIWARKTREILYLNAEGIVMVVDYATSGGSFLAGKPRSWLAVKLLTTGAFPSFDLHPDGRRLMALLLPKSEATPGNLHAKFLLNFTNDLRRVLVGR